ncbi:trichohyalin-like [Patiria miniata]|uniref:Uncharacterized protein n=1 Tax=Patiria miniata TaxID=46514 RepID=A0A914BC27_PATMI|nr:trichohyalin-like [Patiria miniata]XP_038073784.1 trichohyalin-like [Patiria miniata]
MSLFSGMKLASSSPDKHPTDSAPRTTEPKIYKSPSTETEKSTSNSQETRDSSQFSFILDTANGKRPTSTALETEHTCTGESSSKVDRQLCKDRSPKSQPPESAIDDLNFDLDPIKVIRDAHTQGQEHRPAGFDLRDVDFSAPSEQENQEDEHSALDAKSTSSFSFITKESLVSTEESCDVEEDSQAATGNESVEEVSEDSQTPGRRKLEIGKITRRDDGETGSLDRRRVYMEEHVKQLLIIKKSTCDVADRVVQLAKDCVLSGFSLLEKQHQLQALQQQQQQAVNEEDYEKAEELHLQCQTMEDDIGQSGSLLPRDHPALRNLLTDLQTLHEQEKAARQSMTKKYRTLISEQEEAVADARGRHAQWESDRLRKVQEERNKLDRDLGHLHLDKEHLSKRDISLADQIAEGTAPLRQSRDSLIDDRAKVQDEIQILEAKLSALRLQENVISEAILKKDREIATVTADFEDERSALEREKGVLEGAELDLKRRGEELKEEEQRLADGMEEVKMTEERESRLLTDLQEDLAKEEDAIDNLKDKNCCALPKMWQDEKSATLSKTRESFLKKKEAVKLRVQEVRKATSSLLQSQTRVVSLRKRVSDTEGHIASLNESKQLAVSGRNFAEAKKLTEEIKRLTAEGQCIQVEMEALSKSNDERSETVKTMMEDAERLQEEVKEEERQAELTVKDELLEHIADLREQLQSVSQSPLAQALQKAELVSSSLQVKLLCLRHQQPFPAELEDLAEGFPVEETEKLSELTQEESKVGEERLSGTSEKTSELELERLEGQLKEAVEKEDYDNAELLQRHIDAIQQQNKHLESDS